jgi:hypothetical protein
MLTCENIKSELSYAYLHAIASRAGFNCECTNRHADNVGIDARVSEYGRLDDDSVLTDFSLDVQLKATAKRLVSPRTRPSDLSYVLKVDQYDKLRNESAANQKILVVLFLPPAENYWLVHKTDQMVARRCAYWVSLRGAIASTNTDSLTVYLPKANILTVDSLRVLMTRLSRQERITYAG